MATSVHVIDKTLKTTQNNQLIPITFLELKRLFNISDTLNTPDDSSTVNPLATWQSGIFVIIESFLSQAKDLVSAHSLVKSSLIISYAKDSSSAVDIEATAHILQYFFSSLGISVILCPLSDAKELDEQLKNQTYAVILCTPSYAKKVEESPELKQILEQFGRTKKNALHPLLCEGGFGDTALKIVNGHYLIRSYQVAAKRDPLTSIPAFIDIFFNLSGNQGLGILPDVLDLKETKNVVAEVTYRTVFIELQSRHQHLTIDYHLRTSLEQGVENHSLKEYLEPATFPVIKQNAGFQPVIEEFLESTSKISLILCPTKADTELTGLALNQALISKNSRVLSIECADYPGKSAGNCVQLALQKMKFKTPDIEAMKGESLVIVLKGYQNIGAYDNLWVKNKLSTWKNVKLLVTCQADFFRFRGYLSCFLADVSNRSVDDLLVYKIPSFASIAAKKAAVALLSYMPEVLDAKEIASLSPRYSAEQSELTAFLKKINNLWIQEGYLSCSLQQNPQFFISYAWEGDKTSLARQQGHLSRISEDLATLGFSAWLDIERMSGDIDEQMSGNIANSQAVLVIETPRYTERSLQNTNVKKEFDAIIQKSQSDERFKVFPLRFLPGPIPRALENHRNECDFTGIDEDYLLQMTHPEFGFIPKFLLDTANKKALYQTAYGSFQEQLQLLVAKHLIVNQGQNDVQAYDMDNRLKRYIAPYGLYTEVSTLEERFDLVKHFQIFLNNADSRTAIVLGRAGSGKSLFALSTFKTLLQQWHEYQSMATPLPMWLPVYIQLRNHAKDPEHCIENTLRQWNLTSRDIEALKQGLGHQQRILFILDGYDELGNKLRPNLSQRLHEWPLAKLLITGRPEYFNKDHQPLETLSLYANEGGVVLNSAQVVYVSPFSPDEIQRYVAYYDQSKNKDKKLDDKSQNENTYQILQKLPGMMVLLDNPFLLTLVLQSLPQLLKNRRDDKAVTRTDIYQAFTETWFLQETKGRDLEPRVCEQFSEELAFRFFQAKTISVSDMPEKQDLWTFFSNDTHQAAQDASPLRFSGGEYSFVHKSLYEYFVATRLWKVLFESNGLALWQVRPLTEERSIIDFLSEICQDVNTRKTTENCLLGWVEASKESHFPVIAAANAITVLNAMRVSFSARNFAGIRINGADLSGGIFDGANFEGANLSNVAFVQAWLSRASFKNANCSGIHFGEWPARKHASTVTALRYSRDGRFLAVATGNFIVIYDAKTLQKLRTHEGHSKEVKALAYSPDGRFLASGSMDNTVKVWDGLGARLESLRTHEGHSKEVKALAYSPDGRFLASGSMDNTVKVWDGLGAQLNTLRTHEGHREEVWALAYSPDGRYLASGSWDKTLKVWDGLGAQLNTLRTHEGHSEEVNALAYSPDGRFLASGSMDNTVKVWDGLGARLESLRTHEGHSHWVYALAYSPDGRFLASASSDNTVKVWDGLGARLEPLRTHEGHSSRVYALAYSPDGRFLASGSGDNTLKVWDGLGAGLELFRTHEGHSGSVNTLAYSPDGRFLASGSVDRTAEVWDAGLESLRTHEEEHSQPVSALAYSPDGRFLASGGDNTVKVWDGLGVRLESLRTHKGHRESVTALAYSPDGRFLASGSIYGTVKVWDGLGAQLNALRTHERHSHMVKALAYSPDGRFLASGSIDRTVKVWDGLGAQLNALRTHEGHSGSVDKLAYSPDGRFLASGSTDMTLKVWDGLGARLESLHTHEGHSSYVYALAYSPDGRYLASASRDKTVKVWDGLGNSANASSPLVDVQVPDCVNVLFYNPKYPSLFATVHRDRNILQWKITQDTQCTLLSRTKGTALIAQDLNLEGADQLPPLETEFLKQKGAVGEPCAFVEPAERPVLTSESLPSQVAAVQQAVAAALAFPFEDNGEEKGRAPRLTWRHAQATSFSSSTSTSKQEHKRRLFIDG